MGPEHGFSAVDTLYEQGRHLGVIQLKYKSEYVLILIIYTIFYGLCLLFGKQVIVADLGGSGPLV